MNHSTSTHPVAKRALDQVILGTVIGAVLGELSPLYQEFCFTTTCIEYEAILM